MWYNRRWYRGFKDEQRHRKVEPRPLPLTRKRRLSGGMVKPQPHSLMLQRLPMEIRHMIYKDCIADGSEHRHVVERLQGIRVHNAPGWGPRRYLWGLGCNKDARSNTCKPYSSKFFANNVCSAGQSDFLHLDRPTYGRGGLQLAMTCRQIYLESINLYYGTSY